LRCIDKKKTGARCKHAPLPGKRKCATYATPALEYGIDLDRVLAEVHRSNMSKLGVEGGVVADILRRVHPVYVAAREAKAREIEQLKGAKPNRAEASRVD
jgi:predicted HAD superfamily Cof-like phosphohydrolase